MNTKRFRSAFGWFLSLTALAILAAFVGVGEAAEKCQVCHLTGNGNEHTIEIPCKQVAKFLSHHPKDHPGSCGVISGESFKQ
jgi:hypothetical protein